MPAREDIELATPRCWKRRLEHDGQHGVTCYTPMRYSGLHNWWRCPVCGGIVDGGEVAARRSATAVTVM